MVDPIGVGCRGGTTQGEVPVEEVGVGGGVSVVVWGGGCGEF